MVGLNKTIQQNNKQVLKNIYLSFFYGAKIGIIGLNGSGKSTLAKLIARFWDVDAGAVLVGGIDIREMSLTDLTEKISYVSQDNFLFNMSLRDNIRIGKPEATDKEVEWAAAQAGCDEFISRFPQGYDTNAGDAGARLSGGERQRISIARSLLKHASVLLADEATAALDAQTAHQVTDDILSLTGVTRIVVTHTLEQAALRRYDGILVLKNGRIAESGTFDALMARKGYFYALYTVSQ